MNKNNSLSQFTNLYSLSKTLRFELIPEGRTEEWIKKHNIIGVEFDEEKKSEKLVGKDAIIAENYKYVKRMIDAMHRVFINEALTFHPDAPEKAELDRRIAELAEPAINDRSKINKIEANQRIKEHFKKILDNAAKRWIAKFDVEMPNFWDEDIEELKTKISKTTEKKSIKGYNSAIKRIETLKKKSSEVLKKTDVGVMFQNEGTIRLLEWKIRRGDVKLSAKELEQGKSEEPMPAQQLVDLLREFNKFFTYFEGFNKNRANVYNTTDNISGSILHRVFSQNLRFHLENINKWNTFQRAVAKNSEKNPAFDDFYQTLKAEKEAELGISFDQVFTLSNFINSVGQSGIDNYNKVIGGLPELFGGKGKTQGANELINRCRQQVNGSKNEFPRLRELYKQILSKNDHTFIDVFEDDSSLISALESFHNHQFSEMKEGEKSFVESYLDTVQEQLSELKPQKDKITISKETISHLSHEITGYWGNIGEGLLAKYEQTKYKKQKKFTISEIEEILREGIENDRFELDANVSMDLLEFFKQRLASLISRSKECWTTIEKTNLLKSKKIEGNRSEESEKRADQIAAIKAFLESCLGLSSFIRDWQKDLTSDQCQSWSDLLSLFADHFQVIGLYNMTRNFISQKPYSTEKIKLNFEKETLLKGWDKNKEKDNYGVILEKGGQYYLAIMTPDSNLIFRDEIKGTSEIPNSGVDSYYKKINYKQLTGLFRQLPRILFSKKGEPIYRPSQEIIDIKDQKLYTKKHVEINGPSSLMKYIDFCKNSVMRNKEWVELFGLTFSSFLDSSQYETVDEFYEHLESQMYSIWFEYVDSETIENYVNSGKLYLFQIYNKDFSTKKRKKKERNENLHTTYWRALFDEKNLNNTIFKLNGKAEIFFRKSSVKWSKDKMEKGFHSETIGDDFEYPIIRDKRFTKRKYIFHCPVSINVKSKPIPIRSDQRFATNLKINDKIRAFLKSNQDIKIIGIDRGEKHLLYYSLIDQKGRILKQGSWNKISNGFVPKGQTEERLIDYKAILDKKEKERDEARKSWARIENIKDFKSGYLSQIVHVLAKMIVEENAVVVLEDLNLGFKRSRFGIEKQVYQKFEKALIDKLNFLVFKDQTDAIKAGHFLKAYQLSGAYHQDSLRLQKQSGILFYTTASYTSTTDPVTGFLKNVYSSYQNVDQAVQFWRSFDSIIYNATKQRFEFTYTLGKIASKSMEAEDKESEVLNPIWTVCSCVERSKYTRYEKLNETERKEVDEQNVGKKGKHEIFIVTHRIKEALEIAGVTVSDGLDVKALLESKTEKSDAKLHKSMIYAFNAIMTMRVTDPNFEVGTSENDFILSPVEPFYDSRKIRGTSDQIPSLPENGDANGAYNIARKGLCILDRINNDEDSLVIDKKTWQNTVQDEAVVQEQKAKWQQSLQHYANH